MAKSELARSKRENELLKEIQIKDKATIVSQRYISGSLILISFLLVGLLFVLYKGNQAKKQMNIVLEHRVQERTKALNTLNLELSRSNEELEKFAYIASHDLKEPLRSIVSFTGLLKREIKDQISDKTQEYLNFIIKGGTQMQDVIEAILEYSTLKTKPEEISEFDTNSIVEDATQLLSEFIKKQKGIVNIENELPKLIYNRQRILILFKNLIENGLKYNDAEIPTVTISYESRGSKGIFIFKDNGIGIKEERQDLIFVMFKRLHPYNAYQGTGIGLSYCKKIVDAMGGEIKLFSQPDRGSEFQIILPNSVVIES